VDMLQRVMGEVRKRLERNGGQVNDVIFGKWAFYFQCVKWVELKVKKESKFYYMYIVFICVKTK